MRRWSLPEAWSPAERGLGEGMPVPLHRTEQLVLGAVLPQPVAEHLLATEREHSGVALEGDHRRLRPLAVAGGPELRLAAQPHRGEHLHLVRCEPAGLGILRDRKSTRLNSSHVAISY